MRQASDGDAADVPAQQSVATTTPPVTSEQAAARFAGKVIEVVDGKYNRTIGDIDYDGTLINLAFVEAGHNVKYAADQTDLIDVERKAQVDTTALWAGDRTRQASSLPPPESFLQSGCSRSPSTDQWHFCGHDGHEGDVGFQRQAGHVDDSLGDVFDVHSWFRHGRAVSLQDTRLHALCHLCRRVADVDLSARDVVCSTIQRCGFRQAGDGMLCGCVRSGQWSRCHCGN